MEAKSLGTCSQDAVRSAQAEAGHPRHKCGGKHDKSSRRAAPWLETKEAASLLAPEPGSTLARPDRHTSMRHRRRGHRAALAWLMGWTDVRPGCS